VLLDQFCGSRVSLGPLPLDPSVSVPPCLGDPPEPLADGCDPPLLPQAARLPPTPASVTPRALVFKNCRRFHSVVGTSSLRFGWSAISLIFFH
jgi:hypothetical protein